MVEFSKHEIKHHPSIMSIFVRFIITANILEPLQEISQMKRDIKVLITKSDRNQGNMANPEYLGKTGGRVLGYPSKLTRPLVNLSIQGLLPDRDGYLKIGLVVVEDFPTWDIILLSLGYQVLKIYAPTRFKKFLKDGNLSGD